MKLTSSAAFVSVGLNETVVSINDSDTTSVEFELSSYPVNEAEESLEVCVVLGAVIEREASVRLVTGDVTAHSVSDYTQTNVTLTFQSLGSTRLCASVPITNDNVVEESERFLVFLTTADEALHARGDAVSVTVTDNDQVTVSLERAELSVEEEEGEVELCVRLVGAIEKDVTVLLAPAPGTAHGKPTVKRIMSSGYNICIYLSCHSWQGLPRYHQEHSLPTVSLQCRKKLHHL